MQNGFCLTNEVSVGGTPIANERECHSTNPPLAVPKISCRMRGRVLERKRKRISDTAMASPGLDNYNSPGGQYVHDRQPIPELSCKECRRRKSRCDRGTPKCTLCKRSNRSCEYGTKSRPLTRRYVTELENALAGARAALQQYVPESGEPDGHLDFTEPVEAFRPTDHSVGISDSFLHSGVTTSNQHQHDQPRMNDHADMFQTPLRSLERQEPANGSVGPTNMPLEASPSSGNWEWDERAGRTNGNRFVDGMASLTSNSNDGGYLGVASGAALLRVTDPNPSESGDQVDSRQNSGESNDPVLRIPSALTSLGQLEPFVEAYFTFFHRSYPIVHEATFRAQFMEVIPRPQGKAWQVLLFVLSAVGAFTVSTEPSEVDLGLFEAAKARMSIDVLETGNILLVQALTLTSNYMQKRNKPNSGYNYMGLARRTAMAIGLHKEIQATEMSLFVREMRRRIWHCLYIFDVGAIITFSRPLDFPHNGVDVELPMNVHDTTITQGTKQTPQPATETTIYTHLRAQASFHMATSEIYSRMISTPFPSASELIDADDRLITPWQSSLPSHFQETVRQEPRFRLCHSILRWRYRNFRTLMYRPILIRRVILRCQVATNDEENNSYEKIAIQRCLEAARESVDLISYYWRHEHQNTMACWYGLYFLFQAVLIPIYCLRNDPQCSEAVEWREEITKAMQTIESMSRIIESASLFLEKIRSVCGPYLDLSLDGWGRPTEESPQTQIANLYPLTWPALDIAQMDGLDSSL